MRYTEDPLFADEKRKHPALTLALLLIITVLALTLVLNHINNSRVDLRKETVTVDYLPSPLEGFCILHISDLHGIWFGKDQSRLRDTLASASYDAVCITGDMTGADGDSEAFLSLLDLLGTEKPVFFIPGDEDPPAITARPTDGGGCKAAYILEAEARGAVYLDAPVKITVRGANLWFSPEWVYTLDYAPSEEAYRTRLEELRGQPASPERDAALEAVEYQIAQLDRIRAARREMLETDVHIALTHHPLQMSALRTLQEWTGTDNDSYVRTVSLVLAGHYVGGQWRLPGIGAVRLPESAETGGGGWFPDDKRATGLSMFLGIPQYISPGLGTSAAIGLPPFRLFNTPAVTVLTLTSRLTH